MPLPLPPQAAAAVTVRCTTPVSEVMNDAVVVGNRVSCRVVGAEPVGVSVLGS